MSNSTTESRAVPSRAVVGARGDVWRRGKRFILCMFFNFRICCSLVTSHDDDGGEDEDDDNDGDVRARSFLASFFTGSEKARGKLSLTWTLVFFVFCFVDSCLNRVTWIRDWKLFCSRVNLCYGYSKTSFYASFCLRILRVKNAVKFLKDQGHPKNHWSISRYIL